VDGRVGSAPKPSTTGGDGLGDRGAVVGGHDERLRRSRGQACRGKPGTDPVERSAVNVGTSAPRGVRGSCRGERTRPLGRRSAPAEAEGSPKRGTPSKVGAALTTPGRVSTVRWPRVRQARQDGVTRVNQCSNAPQDVRQLEPDGSGLVSSAQSHREGGRTRRSVWFAGRGGHGEGLRRNRGDAAGGKAGHLACRTIRA
jgi:hypothetical protein